MNLISCQSPTGTSVPHGYTEHTFLVSEEIWIRRDGFVHYSGKQRGWKSECYLLLQLPRYQEDSKWAMSQEVSNLAPRSLPHGLPKTLQWGSWIKINSQSRRQGFHQSQFTYVAQWDFLKCSGLSDVHDNDEKIPLRLNFYYSSFPIKARM